MNDEECNSDLRELAADIARRIANDSTVITALSGRWDGEVCPPTKLCCFLGYNCSTPFTCPHDFRCPNGFVSGLAR